IDDINNGNHFHVNRQRGLQAQRGDRLRRTLELIPLHVEKPHIKPLNVVLGKTADKLRRGRPLRLPVIERAFGRYAGERVRPKRKQKNNGSGDDSAHCQSPCPSELYLAGHDSTDSNSGTVGATSKRKLAAKGTEYSGNLL